MHKTQKAGAKTAPKMKPPATGASKKPPKKEPAPAHRGPVRGTHSPALTKDWVQLEKNVHVCGGNVSQAHKKFKGHNKQSAATCIVACAFCTLEKMNLWTREVLDRIIETGTNLYLRSRQIPENRCPEYLKLSQIYKYFYITNLKISMRLGVDPISDRITRDSTMLQKLEALLAAFFAKYASGVFTCQNTHFAIWKADHYYYLFDPTEHTRSGGKWMGLPGAGYSYCIRSNTLTFLADIIAKNCPLRQINRFSIHSCTIEKLIQVNTIPPEKLEDVRPPSVSVDIGILIQSNLAPPHKKEKKVLLEPQPDGEHQGSVPVSRTSSKADVVKKPSEANIPLERPRLQSVTNFMELIAGKVGILRASTHQRDPRFTRYLGAQGFANGLAALTMLRQERSKYWVKKHVDDALRLGERVHHDLKKLPSGELPKKITLNEIDYTPKMEKYRLIGRVVSDDDRIFGLAEALRDFLRDNDCCILNGPNIVAIWEEDRKYYMFDPEERSAIGKKVEGTEKGVACVTWWSTLEDLLRMYLHNIPRELIKERFTLSQVKIKDYAPLADDWYNFKPITLNKWILRGHFSQQDRRFPADSRNSQCTANATMALAYKELREEKDWSSDTIDQVLVSGDDYYHMCVEYLTECGRFKDKFLMADELKRSFNLEDKKVILEIDDCLVNGILRSKDNSGIMSLKRGFEEFFNDSVSGIVTANLQTMAVWKRDDFFYYCDSHSRDARGVVAGFGTACLLRTMSIEDLTNCLLLNFGANPQNLYNISRINITLIDVTDDGVVKPPLNAYVAISDFVAILPAYVSCKSHKFELTAGKQEVPMCLTALGFNAVAASSTWTKEDFDEIMNRGDKFYAETMEANYAEDVPEELNVDDVTTDNAKTQMTIGQNAITIEFEEVSAGNFEDNLKQGLESLGERSDQEGLDVFQSILESSYMIASMWRDENLYYLFDPRPRDEKGQVYGKDDWSVKIEPPVEEIPEEVPGEGEEEGENEENEDKDDWNEEEDKDELAGGDNLGEQEDEVQNTQYTDHAEDADEETQPEEVEEEEDKVVVEKKGSNFWRAKEEEGKACVMRFSRLEDLIQHVLDNSPPNGRPEIEYTLKAVKIVSNTPVVHEVTETHQLDEVMEEHVGEPVDEPVDEFAGDWNEFKEFDYGRWILRGSKNLNDALYPASNRGRQAIPICLVALALVNLYETSKFNGRSVDFMLSFGDRLHTLLKKLRSKDLKANKELGLSDDEIEMILDGTPFELKDYPKKVCIGEKMAVWDAIYEAVLGDTTSKEPEVVHNLASGVTKFFEENKFGILINRNYPVAIWSDDVVSYMFDPHPNGPSGNKSPMGVACITRFKDVEHLVQTYLNDLPKVGDHFFEIHALTFNQEHCVRQRHPEEKVEKAPRLGGFGRVTAGKSILRGDVKLDCTNFSRGVNVHSSAIALVALALSKNKDPEIWTHIIVNEILSFGEELYKESVAKLGDKFDPWSDRLDVCKVNTDFTIGSLRVNTAIRFKEQRGIVDVKNSKTLNLRQGMEKFFEENSHGVLVADKFILGMWEQVKGKDDAHIYIFDPNSRGGTGLPGQGGVACVMKFINAKLASDHVMSCMMDIDKTTLEFSIIPVEIVVGTIAKCKVKPCPCPKGASRISTGSNLGMTTTAGTKLGITQNTTTGTSVTGTKMHITTAGTTHRSKLYTTTNVGVSGVGKSSRFEGVKPPCSSGTTHHAKSSRLQSSVTVKKTGKCGTETTIVVPALMKTPVGRKPPTCPDKAAILEEKRCLRRMAEEKRAKEEKRRCALLGRTGYYELTSNQAIIRGQHSVQKDRELTVNLAAFVFMKVAPDLSKWTYKQIEVVLEAGYQLYVDSYNAYKPPTPKLNLQHVLRRIMIKDYCAKFEIRTPIIGRLFTREYLLAHLSQFFLLTNFCMLSYEKALVSIYFKGGFYYLFDPYSRDLFGNEAEDGAAVMMRFGDLSELVDRVLKNLKDPNETVQKKYALIVVVIRDVERIAQATTRVNCL